MGRQLLASIFSVAGLGDILPLDAGRVDIP